MTRLIVGVLFVLIALVVATTPTPETTPEDRLWTGISCALIGLLFAYFGARARRRLRSEGPSLEQAARKGNLELVRRLIETGTDIHKGDEAALHRACFNRHHEIVRALLQAGANPNTFNGAHTALMAGALIGHPDIVAALLQSGAVVDTAREDGKTALFDAADSGSVEAVRLLIHAGANPNHTEKKGYSAIYNAGGPFFKKPDVVVELLEAGAVSGGVYYAQRTWGGLDTSQSYSWEIGLDARDSLGNTLLMIAAWGGRRNAVKRLISEVPIDAANKKGHTALMLAAMKGHRSVVADLLEVGADSTKLDAEGKTAAVLAEEKGHPGLFSGLPAAPESPKTK